MVKLKILFFLILLALGGCSSEPSEDVIKNLVKNNFPNREDGGKSNSSVSLSTLLNNMWGILEYKDVKKINCTSLAKNSFECEYIVKYTHTLQEDTTEKELVLSSKFIRVEKDWRILINYNSQTFQFN